MINQDSIIFGVLATCVASIVSLSQSKNPSIQKFFKFFPSVLLVYLIPSFLTTVGILDISNSTLYQFNIDNLLPACLILMTLSLDLRSLARLGPKCIMVFLAGTVGIVLGGPFAVAIVKPFFGDALPPDSWKVLATLAGSWIGGGVNQAAMKEVFQVEETIFVTSVAIDIIVGGFFWMSTLLFLANKNEKVNRWLRADPKLMDEINLQNIVHNEENPAFVDYCWMVAIAFGGTALCKFLALPLVAFIKEYAPSLETYLSRSHI